MDYIIIGLLAVVAILLIIVLAKLSDKKNDTAVGEQLERMQKDLREEVQMLEVSRNQRMSALQVRDWAVTKLGMSKIDKSQITYVTTASGDRFEHGEEPKETPKVVAGLIKGFSTVVEFMN